MGKFGRQIRIEHPRIVRVDAERVPGTGGSCSRIRIGACQKCGFTKRNARTETELCSTFLDAATTLCLFCSTRAKFLKRRELEPTQNTRSRRSIKPAHDSVRLGAHQYSLTASFCAYTSITRD